MAKVGTKKVGRKKVLEHPTTAIVKAGDAFLESIYWSTPGVINLVQEKKGTEPDGRPAFSDNVGTASAIRWHGRTMLITADHVVSGAAPNQLAFFTRPSGAIGTVIKPGEAGTVRHSLPITRIVRCKWEDLAILELGKLESDVNLRFIEIDNREQSPKAGTQVLAIGYPASSAVVVNSTQEGQRENRALGVVPDLVDGDVEKPGPDAQYLKGFNPDAHILVSFNPSRAHEKAPGFSGTGFWYFKQKQTIQQLWYARPRLGGVCTHQYESSRLLRGVGAELVVKFLEEIG